MLRFVAVFIAYLLFVVACCNYSSCNHTCFTDWLSFNKRLSFNFTIEPSVSVGSVPQFWTNTGLWYVTEFQLSVVWIMVLIICLQSTVIPFWRILVKLFNLMLEFNYVSRLYGYSCIVPIPNPKTKHSPLTIFIAVSCLLSKLYESCIYDLFQHFFRSLDNQLWDTCTLSGGLHR